MPPPDRPPPAGTPSPLATSVAASATLGTPTTLVLPLATLQALWHESRTTSSLSRNATLDANTARRNTGTLLIAHGSLVLQSAGLQTQALVGPLRTTPLADAWTPPDPMQGLREGVSLVAIAPASARDTTPTLPTAEDWLAQHAPAWRLVSRALRPALALFWMSADGAGFLGWRSPTGEWSAIAWLELPGSGLRRVTMGQNPSRLPVQPVFLSNPAAASGDLLPAYNSEANPDPELDPDLDRFSRQRLALGAPVLHTLQHRSTVVIGLGRTGSPLVHSAVRLGMPVLGLDPDVVEPHNLDGDFSPLHEGWTKAAALRKQLSPLARPGAAPDLRALDVASPAAGALIAATDGAIVTAVDNSRALLWANAWALALGRVHIVIASGLVSPGGLAEAELRVLLPGEACVMCAGGLAEPLERVLASLGTAHTPRSAPLSEERPGSLRSWSVLAGHHALRALEQVAAGRVRHSLFRRLTEQDDGGLRVEERTVLRPVGGVECPMCRQLGGAGLRAVSAERLRQLLEGSHKR